MWLLFSIAFLFYFTFNLSGQDEVKIGKYTWMTKNLDVDKFRNGDKIPEAKTKQEWLKAAKDRKPAWCYYNNKVDKANGKLYNYYAVIDKRGLAPEGWSIPNVEHAGSLLDSNKIWQLQSSNWSSKPCTYCNSSTFSALPSGMRWYGDFAYKGEGSLWWLNYAVDDTSALQFYVGWGKTGLKNYQKATGLSIRCVKSNNINTTLYQTQSKEGSLSDIKIGDIFEDGVVFHTEKDLKEKIVDVFVVSLTDVGKAIMLPRYYDTIKTISSSLGEKNTKQLSKYDSTFSSAAFRALSFENNGGTGWYIPSVEEILIMDRNLEIINQKLRSIPNADEMIGDYWTSSLNDEKSFFEYEISKTKVYGRYDNYSHELSNGFYTSKIDYSYGNYDSSRKIRVIKGYSIWF